MSGKYAGRATWLCAAVGGEYEKYLGMSICGPLGRAMPRISICFLSSKLRHYYYDDDDDEEEEEETGPLMTLRVDRFMAECFCC